MPLSKELEVSQESLAVAESAGRKRKPNASCQVGRAQETGGCEGRTPKRLVPIKALEDRKVDQHALTRSQSVSLELGFQGVTEAFVMGA